MPSGKAEISAIVRPARPTEPADLSLLCLRSKAVWGYGPDFIADCRAELTLGPEDLATTAVAERRGPPVGVVQVSKEGRTASPEKLFVEPHAIGTGIGALLFAEALTRARAAGAAELVVESDPGAAGFYARMGARTAGEVSSGSAPGRTLPRLVIPL